jgi:hypothetical protein
MPPRAETVQHVLRIEDWRFNYAVVAVDTTGPRTEPYHDLRDIELFGRVLKPKGIVAHQGRVKCVPMDKRSDASERPARKFGGWLTLNEPEPALHVGSVSYRGRDYSATLRVPKEILQTILSALKAGRYRYVSFDAAKGSRDAAIFSFDFSERLEGNDA